MIESPPAPAEHLSFEPVPVASRTDGWTAARQQVFIRELRAARSVTRAARAAGMTRAGAYRLRARPDAASFAAAWDAVFAAPPPAAARIRSAAADLWDRALNGRVVPIMRKGVQVGHRVRADNAALMTLMRRYDRAGRDNDRRRR